MFITQSIKCEQISLNLPSGRNVKNQNMLPCYGRQSVVPVNTLPVFYHHLKEIGIYSNNYLNAIIIFKREQNSISYSLLHLKTQFNKSYISYVNETELHNPPTETTSLIYLTENLNPDDFFRAKALLLNNKYVFFFICSFSS